MKDSFRQSMAWLHTWAGLCSGWVLFFVFVTGSAAYFKHEITRWMKPEMPLRVEATHPPATIATQLAWEYLNRQPGQKTYWHITLPDDGRRAGYPGCSGFPVGCPNYPGLRGYPRDLTVQWAGNEVRLDSATGKELPDYIPARETEGGVLFDKMHHSLHYLPGKLGRNIVAICTLLTFLAIITGIVVHKKIFKDFFTFRHGKGQRSWLDGHNVVSVLALPFFLMITYSGLAEWGYMPKPLLDLPVKQQGKTFIATEIALPPPAAIPLAKIVAQAEQIFGTGQTSRISYDEKQGDSATIQVTRQWGTQYPFASRSEDELNFDPSTGALQEKQRTHGMAPAHQALWWLVGPHFAWFAGAGLRWLLFLSGLLGCVMIGTGLILWTVKRRSRHEKEGSAPSLGLRLVERLNVGVLVGLPIGVATYFWANRLLPVSMAERAEWETLCLFLSWAWVALYAFWRPIRKAWAESLWLATAAFGLIPLLNWLTTNKHLGQTIPHGDWVLAGVDLTTLALAAIFGAAAWKLRRRWSTRTADAPPPSLVTEEAKA